MATLSVTNPTLLDLAKATDPDGKIANIVEILNETNEVLADMSWVEGNLATAQRFVPVFLLQRGVSCMAAFSRLNQPTFKSQITRVC